MICIFGPCLELGYSASACDQFWSCRSFPRWDSLWDAERAKADRATPGSTVNGTTAVFGLVNHSRRINLCWLCCSTRSLEVRSLPAFLWLGWERKWVRKQRETKHEMCWFLSAAARRAGVGCGEVLSAFLTFWIGFRKIIKIYIHYIYQCWWRPGQVQLFPAGHLKSLFTVVLKMLRSSGSGLAVVLWTNERVH